MPTHHFNYKYLRLLTILTITLLTQACSMNVPIDVPSPSTVAYVQQGESKQTSLKFEDELASSNNLSHGRLTVNLSHEGASFKPAAFVESGLKAELNARNLPIDLSESGQNIIVLEKFEILNHRVSGFSPLVSISTLQAALKTETGTKRIASMVKRAKVPIWTMKEIIEPCYNEPTEVMIKELTAKINRELIGYSLADEVVDQLVNKIRSEGAENKLSYMDVYELGFSNNQRAIEPLTEFTKHSDEYIRMAAISSLGILDSESSLEFLKSIYQNDSLWHDRGMALKAIGDLDTKEGNAFLKQEKEKWSDGSSREAKWNSMIIDLYLN